MESTRHEQISSGCRWAVWMKTPLNPTKNSPSWSHHQDLPRCHGCVSSQERLESTTSYWLAMDSGRGCHFQDQRLVRFWAGFNHELRWRWKCSKELFENHQLVEFWRKKHHQKGIIWKTRMKTYHENHERTPYCWWFRNSANQLRLVIYPAYQWAPRLKHRRLREATMMAASGLDL